MRFYASWARYYNISYLQIPASVPAHKYLSAFVLNFINIFSISSGYGADAIQIPNLHKALFVSSHYSTLKFMGTWGTGIKDNDTAADIYDSFFELYNDDQNPLDISKKLIADNQELITDKYSSNDFWLTLALAQWETKSLDQKVFEKVKTMIENSKDLEIWKEQGADDKTLKSRQKKLDDFLRKISVEKSRPKERKKQKFAPPIFSTGDCLTFQLQNNNYGGAVILAADEKYGYNLVITTRINQPNLPSAKDFENSEVLFKTFANWKDEPEIVWLMPYQYQKTANGFFKVVASLKVEKDYDPKDLSLKANYSSEWHRLVEMANRQIEYELTSKKSTKRLTVKEFIRNKPAWKLW